MSSELVDKILNGDDIQDVIEGKMKDWVVEITEKIANYLGALDGSALEDIQEWVMANKKISPETSWDDIITMVDKDFK